MTDERRRFFRIDDEAEVSFKTISHDEYTAWSDKQGNGEAEKKAKLEAELSMTIANLKSHHPQLAKVCELLNTKINLCLDSHSNAFDFIEEGELKPINLSACGIAFHTDENIQPNEHILLQLKLKPSGLSLITTGKVVDSALVDGKQQIVRVDFEDLAESNQDLLMQHLFQVQSRNLKKQRDA